jgi:hypothetical protein
VISVGLVAMFNFLPVWLDGVSSGVSTEIAIRLKKIKQPIFQQQQKTVQYRLIEVVRHVY